MTILAVLALSALAMTRGVEILRFEATSARAAAHQIPAAALRGWVGVPGVGGAALQTLLQQTPTAPGGELPQHRIDDLTALLSVHPMSSADWLSLAGMRLVTAQPYDTVIASFAM